MLICGIDEAGRGPLAGSLTVSGVVLHREIDGVNDSKKLTEKRREKLFDEIITSSTHHTVSISAKEIDEVGISEAMKRALREIKTTIKADKYLFDGKTAYGTDGIETIIGGDGKVSEISSASIIAKVTRDREIVELSKIYDKWGFERHKGYGTAEHIENIRKFGFSPIHRKSFRVSALETLPL
jgi:ribonuclease HII